MSSIIGITGVVTAGCLAGLAIAAPRVSPHHDAAVELSAATHYRVTLRTASGFVSADGGGGAGVVTGRARAGR